MKKVLLPSTESEEEPPVPTTESEEEPPVPTIESEEEPLFGEEDEVTPFEVLKNVEPEEPDVEYISSRESQHTDIEELEGLTEMLPLNFVNEPPASPKVRVPLPSLKEKDSIPDNPIVTIVQHMNAPPTKLQLKTFNNKMSELT